MPKHPARLVIFIILFAIISVMLPKKIYAQNQKILDSLERLVNSSKPDSIKMIAYGDLCWGYGFINFDKALYYGNEELKLAKKLNNQEAIALAHSDLGKKGILNEQLS